MLAGLWLLLILTSLVTRGFLPVDETRYVSVAWEMWLRNDFLVPHLNGAVYSHKPPLLFWLYQSGWWLFGVNDWWPRLITPLFALGSLFLIRQLARRLWPGRGAIAQLAPLLLFATLFWALFATVATFDMLLVFFTLLGMLGIVEAWRGHTVRGWLILAVAIGLGVLSKGPVILLHTLPVALSAPWWMGSGQRPDSWLRWYGGILGALLLGALIALAWAVPAAFSGGKEYADAIFWGQSAGRLGGEDVPHSEPVWWYLVRLPLMLLPWIVWPPVWRGLRGFSARWRQDAPLRFCLVWLLLVFLLFSLVGGKRLQYLLPLIPAFVLVVARLLAGLEDRQARSDGVLPGIVTILAGLAIGLVPLLAGDWKGAPWLQEVSPAWGLIAIVPGFALLVGARGPLERLALKWALATTAILLCLHAGPIRQARVALDPAPIGRYLRQLEQQGIPVAHVGDYHGQYQFVGRLERPLTVIQKNQAQEWGRAHPDGRLLTYYTYWNTELARHADFARPYRGSAVAVWSGAEIAAHPEWVEAWPE